MTIEEVLALHNADIHTNRTFSGLMCRNIAVPIHEPASPPGSRLIRGVFFLTLHTEPRFPPPCEPTRTQTSATRHTQPSSTRVTQQTELLGCCSGVFPGSHFALECVSVRQLAPLTNHHCVHDSCAEAHRLTSKSPSRASSFSHLSVPLEREPLPRRAPNPTHTLRSHPPRRTACAAPQSDAGGPAGAALDTPAGQGADGAGVCSGGRHDGRGRCHHLRRPRCGASERACRAKPGDSLPKATRRLP